MPDNKREAVELLVKRKLSVRQACKLVSLPRSAMAYKKVCMDDSSLIKALNELVERIRHWVFGSVIAGYGEKDWIVIINDCTVFTPC